MKRYKDATGPYAARWKLGSHRSQRTPAAISAGYAAEWCSTVSPCACPWMTEPNQWYRALESTAAAPADVRLQLPGWTTSPGKKAVSFDFSPIATIV